MAKYSVDIVTPIFKMDYVYLYEPNEYKGKLNYTITMLFSDETLEMSKKYLNNKDQWTLDKLNECVQEVIKNTWKQTPKGIHVPIRDGAEKDKSGYGPGVTYIKAKSNATFDKPPVYNNKKELIIDHKEIYAGCYGVAAIRISSFTDPAPGGVSAYIKQIQKIKDGERFVRTADIFTPIEVDEPVTVMDL